MKIEKGMYVRTKWGNICEIININDFREPSMKYGVEASYLRDVMFIGDEDISKASHNIIDLIEVGDYVNGHYVQDVTKFWVNITVDDYPQKSLLTEEDIKSIVTKEQFEKMIYEVNIKGLD